MSDGFPPCSWAFTYDIRNVIKPHDVFITQGVEPHPRPSPGVQSGGGIVAYTPGTGLDTRTTNGQACTHTHTHTQTNKPPTHTHLEQGSIRVRQPVRPVFKELGENLENVRREFCDVHCQHSLERREEERLEVGGHGWVRPTRRSMCVRACVSVCTEGRGASRSW